MKRTGTIALFRSGWMTLAVTLLVALFLTMNWYYYHRTKESLDDDMSQRLRVLAAHVSLLAETDGLHLAATGEQPYPYPDSLSAHLLRSADDFGISNALVIREDGVILYALHETFFSAGEAYPYWTTDFNAIFQALEGRPSATNLFRAPDGSYLKAGYAPLPIGAAHAGMVVSVEAGADFLAALSEQRNMLLAATGLSILGILLFTWFTLKATGSLLRARESLMQAETLASMGRMAAGIAHEIRNPLFIIRGAAEKLRERHAGEAPEIEEFVIEEVDRLNGILTDYLLFARDEPTSRSPMDLVTTLGRSIRLIEESIRGAGIELVREFRIADAPFIGEEKKLQQSFLNILLNAEQALSTGGTITVSIDRRGDGYDIRFADTGPGIPAREIERIFEPFYTTKPKGSGLGLSIVKRIVEDHGGSVHIDSLESRGTTVALTLPSPAHPPGGSI